MANTVNLEFAGDASKLAQAGKRAEGTVKDVGGAVKTAGDDFDSASKATGEYVDRVGKLGAAVDGASTAIDDAGAAVQAMADVQDAARAKAARLAQATNDIAQAQEDANQAMIDGKQATLDIGQAQLDAEQANLDAATAQKDYNDAVKEHGKNSLEAKQAALDLKQAQADLKQANLDVTQAQADANQATIDGTQATLDLNEATREANPPELQQWADQINMITPILSGMVGVVGLVTAAQWAWNAAQLASPTTWIILAIVALVAIIVVIATKTTWFQDIWAAAWGGIKRAASAVGSWFKDTLYGKWIKGAWDGIINAGKRVWDWMGDLPGKLKGAFSRVGDFISAPFRAGFNMVSTAWNNTVGRLSWSVPGWVPGIGGNSFSAPRLPKFHSGGPVPGTPGSEVMAILQAGETVSPASSAGGGEEWIRVDLGDLGDALLGPIAEAVRKRGGRVSALGVRVVNGTVPA
jgi:hypothetical protein